MCNQCVINRSLELSRIYWRQSDGRSPGNEDDLTSLCSQSARGILRMQICLIRWTSFYIRQDYQRILMLFRIGWLIPRLHRLVPGVVQTITSNIFESNVYDHSQVQNNCSIALSRPRQSLLYVGVTWGYFISIIILICCTVRDGFFLNVGGNILQSN
jgi:hypothetical protein